MSFRTFFNAHHSPVGAFATLTLGCKGPRGGLGLELGGPANEGIYVGAETADGGRFQAFPFYGGAETQSEDYDVEGLSDFQHDQALSAFPDSEIKRRFGAAVDEWTAGDLRLRIYSPPRSVPDPSSHDVREQVVPSVLVELTLDNRAGSRDRKAFFGYAGSERAVGMRLLDEPGLTGVGQGGFIAIATEDSDVYAGLGWQPEAVLKPKLEENLGFMLGSLGLIVGSTPAGQIRTFRFAVAFFREGTATTGIRTRYLYRRYFDRIEEVLRHTLESADRSVREAERFDTKVLSGLSEDRAFMLAHAIRSYFGSTQLLEREDGRPLWVVHEGEYRMMNTFDLTVDQAFFELALNPWTVRNELDLFVERYAYQDGIRSPGSPDLHAGGIAFTHDMGVANAFAAPGRSGYEQAGLRGCFSYMSSEELTNWVITAGLYVVHTQDWAWARENASVFVECLLSMERRDDPDEAARNGVMGLDAARCEGGAEITTYDSLDASLGQARNNLYLAVKSWAAYLYLEHVFSAIEQPGPAARGRSQAERAAATIIAARNEEGLLPAVIGEGVDARIIPAIEALVYPHASGLACGFGELRSALSEHFRRVLKPGVCKFPDGGWKLSSTSRNSWLSKIYLCQYVAESVLNYEPDGEADRAHVGWLLDEENVYYAWSDQMLAGKAVGSRYYPRGVTAILWLASGEDPLREIQNLLSGSELEAVR